MQVVKLAGVIFALSIGVLISVIFTQPLKATSGEKIVWSDFHEFIAAGAQKKLHCLVRLTYLGVSAPILKVERCKY